MVFRHQEIVTYRLTENAWESLENIKKIFTSGNKEDNVVGRLYDILYFLKIIVIRDFVSLCTRQLV